MAAARCFVLILIGVAAGCRTTSFDDAGGDGSEREWFCEGSASGDWRCIERAPPRGDRQPPGDEATRAQPETDAQPEIDAQPETGVREVRRTQTPALPRGLQLADGPATLTDLPAHYFVVQLLAASSLSSIERFQTENRLADTTAVLIERDGELLYALLAGVYVDREVADRAATLLAEEVRGTVPWVRRLGPLQDAMRRGEALLAGAER